jgi:hypothetical protein
MPNSAAIKLEFKDLDTSKRTGLIKHSAYKSIDKVKDLAHKGMFNKTWKEKTPKFCLNHDYKLQPGNTLRTFDDDEGAYTEVKFGTWTLGNDSMEMADAGIFTGASFEYVATKKDYTEVKGQRIRNLREVIHNETSLLTVEACHAGTGLISLNKAFEALEIKQLSDAEQQFLQTLISNDMNAMQTLISLAICIHGSCTR